MEDYFEIIIYVLFMGLAVLYNVKKSKKNKEKLAEQPSDFRVSDVEDQEHDYSPNTELFSFLEMTKTENVKKVKENVNKKTIIDSALKKDKSHPIYDNQIAVKQNHRKVNLQQAIILSEIINRPYN